MDREAGVPSLEDNGSSNDSSMEETKLTPKETAPVKNDESLEIKEKQENDLQDIEAQLYREFSSVILCESDDDDDDDEDEDEDEGEVCDENKDKNDYIQLETETDTVGAADKNELADSPKEKTSSNSASTSLNDKMQTEGHSKQEIIPTKDQRTSEQQLDCFLCPCGQTIGVPKHISAFRCGVCGTSLVRPVVPSEVDKKVVMNMEREARLRYYGKWLIKEGVAYELDIWLSGNMKDLTNNDTTLIGRFYQKIIDFPLFKDKSSGIDDAIKEIFIILPEVEKARRKRMGKAHRGRIVTLIASPIYYASVVAQEEGECKKISPENTLDDAKEEFRLSLVELMKSLENKEDVRRLINAFSRCHSLNEMPPLIQKLFRARVNSFVKTIEHSLAKPKSKSRFKSLFKVLPRNTILRLLKANLIGSGSSVITSLLLGKPFGGYSLMQHIVSSTSGLKHNQKQIRKLKRVLPSLIVERCEAYITCSEELEDIDSVYDITERQLIHAITSDEIAKEWNCPVLPSFLKTEFASNRKLRKQARLYLENDMAQQDSSVFVEFVGDRKVTNLYKAVIPIIQSKIFGSVMKKHSGFNELVEAIFDAWKDIMSIYKKNVSAEEKRKVYKVRMEVVASRFFTLVHNLLRSDSDGKWHETICWAINSWNASKLNFDIDQMIDSLPEDQRSNVVEDAEKLRRYYVENASKMGDSEPIRKPILKHKYLVPVIAKKLVTDALPTSEQMRTNPGFLSLDFARSFKTQQQTKSAVSSEPSSPLCIYFLEVMYEGEDPTYLAAQGYEKVSVDISGSGQDGAWLWLKKETLKNKGSLSMDTDIIHPITDIRVVNEAEFPSDVLVSAGYVKIDRQLNTSGSGGLFLWYKREVGAPPLTEVNAILRGKEMDNLYERKERHLRQSGYFVVEKHISKGSEFFWQEEMCVYVWAKRLE